MKRTWMKRTWLQRTWMVLVLAAVLVSPLRAAVNEVRVAAVQPDVQCHRVNTPEDQLVPVTKDMVLQQGDEIACDPDGSVTLQFADNSTVVVKNTTQLKIASFFTEGGVVKTEILLKMGEVAAKVHKSEATKSDFRIKSPTGTASVRGTELKTVSYSATQGMRVVLVEGFCNLGGALGNTQVNASQEGRVEHDGEVKSPIQTQSEHLATNAFPGGVTKEEADNIRQNIVVDSAGGVGGGSSGTAELATVATENVNTAVSIQTKVDFNNGVIPPEFETHNALVTQPGQFGPSSADGTPLLTIHTSDDPLGVGFARLKTQLPTGAVLDLEFDHNFITTEEPGQFFSNDDEFTTKLVSNGTPTTIVRNSVFSSKFHAINPGTLPAVMNLPGGNPPEVAFETGFQHFKGSFNVPAGELQLLFEVRNGDTAPGQPDTIVQSAAQIDNIQASIVATANSGVNVITPIGTPTGVGSLQQTGQAQPAGTPFH